MNQPGRRRFQWRRLSLASHTGHPQSTTERDMTAPTPSPQPIPLTAAVLGGSGLLPFMALAFAPALSSELLGRATLPLLATYGVVILSFMGAIYWGLAMAAPSRDRDWLYTASVIPALIGWFAQSFLAPPTAAKVLALAFALLFAFDWRAASLGLSPPWYLRLRLPLTLVVVTCLVWAGSRG
jgi:Protein of unknown function (DUF3429)